MYSLASFQGLWIAQELTGSPHEPVSENDTDFANSVLVNDGIVIMVPDLDAARLLLGIELTDIIVTTKIRPPSTD